MGKLKGKRAVLFMTHSSHNNLFSIESECRFPQSLLLSVECRVSAYVTLSADGKWLQRLVKMNDTGKKQVLGTDQFCTLCYVLVSVKATQCIRVGKKGYTILIHLDCIVFYVLCFLCAVPLFVLLKLLGFLSCQH